MIVDASTTILWKTEDLDEGFDGPPVSAGFSLHFYWLV